MLVYLQSFVAITIGILTTITDFKEKKIYNKTIIYGVITSLMYTSLKKLDIAFLIAING